MDNTIILHGSFLNGTTWEDKVSDSDEMSWDLSQLHGNGAISGIDKITVDGDSIPQWLYDYDEEHGTDFVSLIED